MIGLLEPSYWPTVRVGSVISLHDEQSLNHSLELGLGLNPMEYVVAEVWAFREQSDLGRWWMYRLEQPRDEPELWLIVKVVDEAVDLRMYYVPEGFVPGNRVDQLNAGNDWLFLQGWEGAALIDRPYAQQIVYGEGDSEVWYDNKGVTYAADVAITMIGDSIRSSGLVTEYLADRETADTELLIMEVGDPEDPDGGSITLLLGCPINTNDIDVIRK